MSGVTKIQMKISKRRDVTASPQKAKETPPSRSSAADVTPKRERENDPPLPTITVDGNDVTTPPEAKKVKHDEGEKPKLRLRLRKAETGTGNESPAYVPPPPDGGLKMRVDGPRASPYRGKSPAQNPSIAGGLSPAYGRSPSYGGLSPGYVLGSPRYSPGRPSPRDLGGVLSVQVSHMLSELDSHSVVLESKIAVTTDDAILKNVLAEMARRRILSMPVVDKDTGVYRDVIDVYDILSAVVLAFDDTDIARAKAPVSGQATADFFHRLTTKGVKLLDQSSVGDVLRQRGQRGDCELIKKLDGSSTVLDLIQQAFLNHHTPDGRSVHRAVLLTPSGHIRVLVSQTDVLRYIHRHKTMIEASNPDINLTIAQLGLDRRRVLVVDQRVSALYALHKMKRYKAHTAAVTDADGKLVGSVSATDLRGLTAEHFATLLGRVGHFRAALRDATSGDKKLPAPAPKPLTATRDITLWGLVDLFVGRNAHRAIVVNEASKPVALISITNILEALLRRGRQSSEPKEGSASPARLPPPPVS